MLKINKLADYSVNIMTCMAVDPSLSQNAREIASKTHIAQPTTSKLLKLLVKSGLLQSSQGKQGGYQLSRLSKDISIVDIIEAIDGPIKLTECSSQQSNCRQEQHCNMRDHWQVINDSVNTALQRITLSQLVKPIEQPLLDMTRSMEKAHDD